MRQQSTAERSVPGSTALASAIGIKIFTLRPHLSAFASRRKHRARRSLAAARHWDLARAPDFIANAIAGFIGMTSRSGATPASGRPDASVEMPASGFCCHNPRFKVCRGVKRFRKQSQLRAGQQLTASVALKSCPHCVDLE
jgi:hypothetical protein